MVKTTILLIDIYHTTFILPNTCLLLLQRKRPLFSGLYRVLGMVNSLIYSAARQYGCNYDVLHARSKGIQGNWSKGGKNKRLVDEEEATLVRYCERRILANDPLERLYIIAAANSIL